MNNVSNIAAAGILAAMLAVGGVVSAASTITKESVQKEALMMHRGGKINSSKEIQYDGKQAWQVMGTSRDGKPFTAYFDATTGKSLSVAKSGKPMPRKSN
jgi:hypothetical protein